MGLEPTVKLHRLWVLFFPHDHPLHAPGGHGLNPSPEKLGGSSGEMTKETTTTLANAVPQPHVFCVANRSPMRSGVRLRRQCAIFWG